MSWQLSRGSAGPRRTTRRRSQGVIEGPGRNERGGQNQETKVFILDLAGKRSFPCIPRSKLYLQMFSFGPPTIVLLYTSEGVPGGPLSARSGTRWLHFPVFVDTVAGGGGGASLGRISSLTPGLNQVKHIQ